MLNTNIHTSRMSSLQINRCFMRDSSRNFKIVNASTSVYVIYNDRKIVFDTTDISPAMTHMTIIETMFRPHGFIFPVDYMSPSSQWGYMRFKRIDTDDEADNEAKEYVYYSFILSDTYLMRVVPRTAGRCHRVPNGIKTYYVSCPDDAQVEDVFSEFDVFGLNFAVTVNN